jgi:hypothetical protein
VSLISRYLEAHGVPTVVIGTARDIVEHCGVARFLFVDYPLGSPCGEPDNVGEQRDVFQQALDLLAQAEGPRTTREAGCRWGKGEEWKRLIFTEEQPFQDESAKAEWEVRNNEYRRLKAEGKI